MVIRMILVAAILAPPVSAAGADICYEFTGIEENCHWGELGDHVSGHCKSSGNLVPCQADSHCDHLHSTQHTELGFWDGVEESDVGQLVDWEVTETCWVRSPCHCHMSPGGSFCQTTLVIGHNPDREDVTIRYLLDEWCEEEYDGP